MNTTGKSQALLHLTVFIFGFTGILGALITIPSTSLVVYRMSIAVFLLAIYILLRKSKFELSPRAVFKAFLTGALIAVHWVLFFEAIKVSNVSVTLAVLSSATLFTSLIEPLVYKRKIIFYEVLLGLMVIAGLYLIFNFETQYARGIIYTLISSLAASIFTVINGTFAQKYNPVHISVVELGGGGIMLLLYTLIFAGGVTAPGAISLTDWLWILLLGSICTAFAYAASIKVMKDLTPFTVTMTINLEPVYGILLALLIFGSAEKMTTGFYAGTLILLTSVFMNGLLKRRARRIIKPQL